MIGQANAGFTQPPIGNTYQPGGGNSQVGTAEQQPKENTIQPERSALANTQRQEDSISRRDEGDTPIRVANEDRGVNNPVDTRSDDNAARGSVVDIEV